MLAIDELREPALRIDGHEYPLAMRQNLIFRVQNLGGVGVIASPNPELPRLHAQRLVERHRLQIIHGDVGGQRDDVPELINFSHRLVKNCGDDAAMGVSWRPGVALAQAKTANESGPLLIVSEPQAHAFGVIPAAGEAEISLHANVPRIVAVAFLGAHGLVQEISYTNSVGDQRRLGSPTGLRPQPTTSGSLITSRLFCCMR